MVLKVPSPRNYISNDDLDLDFFVPANSRDTPCIQIFSPVSSAVGSLESSPVGSPVGSLEDSSELLVKTRSNSSSSSSTDYSYCSESTNGFISAPYVENFTSFQVIDNPSDTNTNTILVSRTRLEELEYINENISSIIEEALKNSRGITGSSYQ